MKKFIVLLTVGLLCISCLAGCGSSETAGGKLEAIQEAGKIVMATDAVWAPFEYIGADGEPTGADIEVAQYIADALGVELEIINVSFETISTYLDNGEADMAIAAMTITEERKETMDFSDPYTYSQQYIIVPEDSDVTVVEDLAGCKLGAHLGTTGDFLISDEVSGGVLADTGATANQYTSLPVASQDMLAGNLDAIVCDSQLAENLVAVNEGLKCFPLAYESQEVEAEAYGIAMAKGDDEFVAKINEIIAPMVEEGLVDEWIVEHSALSAELG